MSYEPPILQELKRLERYFGAAELYRGLSLFAESNRDLWTTYTKVFDTNTRPNETELLRKAKMRVNAADKMYESTRELFKLHQQKESTDART